MTQHELEKMQLIQLNIMDDIHKVCCEKGIVYYIIGGTALGAIRHKGYIPWDIDIDIAMPRKDYEQFKAIFNTVLSDKYKYYDYTNLEDHMRPHAIVCDPNSIVHLKYDHLNPAQTRYGIYIDIFPLDNAPDDEKLRKKQEKQLKRVEFLKNIRIPYSYSNKKWKRKLHHTISFLMSVIPVHTFNAYQQKIMKQYENIQTECLCSMGSRYAYSKQCMRREIYGTPVLTPFEGREYYLPERYTEYLTRLYGDYMKLPPLEKRQANMEIFTGIDFL